MKHYGMPRRCEVNGHLKGHPLYYRGVCHGFTSDGEAIIETETGGGLGLENVGMVTLAEPKDPEGDTGGSGAED